ncbi:hypothetical protein [Halospeciosus flavus]|uniref:Uncharacterized protein n=1 Tax=Halospeciosus flavus TaxID=3032283 RepID=A0ABD5Z118_9EURY|nr:hypothetical protein [Halospeciosus flavus]
MSDDNGAAADESVDLDPEAFVDYCRTQAGLLVGRAEELGTEVDALIDELETLSTDVAERLERHQAELDASEEAAVEEETVEAAIRETEDLQADMETKRATLTEKQERLSDVRDLASAYTDLADDLESEDVDGREAMRRVVFFEAKRDAPAYFEDRQTVYEAATGDEEEAGATESDAIEVVEPDELG